MNKVSSIKYLVFSIRAMVFVLILYTLYSILNTNIFAQTSSPDNLSIKESTNASEVFFEIKENKNK